MTASHHFVWMGRDWWTSQQWHILHIEVTISLCSRASASSVRRTGCDTVKGRCRVQVVP